MPRTSKARPVQRDESDRQIDAAGEREIGRGFAEDAGESKTVAKEASGQHNSRVGRMAIDDEMLIWR